MAKKNLYINDISLGTYGIYISSDTILNAPSFDYVEHEVPGRDGTLLQYNNRLTNVIRKFSCYVPEINDVQTAVANVKRLIYTHPGYVKLSSDYEANIYQYGYFVQGFDVKPFDNYRTVSFDLYFSCQPMKRTESVGLAMNNSPYTDGYLELLPRNDSIIQELFNGLPVDMIPSDEWFVATLINLNDTFENVDTTVADGKFTAIIVYEPSTETVTLQNAGFGSAHASNVTAGLAQEILGIYAYSKAVLNWSFNKAGQQTVSNSYDPSSHSQEFTGLMFGFDINKITVKYGMKNVSYTNYNRNQIQITGSDTSFIIDADFKRFGNSLCNDLYNNWTTTESGDTVLTIEVDNNFVVSAVKGNNRMNLSSYFNLYGGFNMNGNSVVATVFSYGYSNSNKRGAPLNVTLTGEWWTL